MVPTRGFIEEYMSSYIDELAIQHEGLVGGTEVKDFLWGVIARGSKMGGVQG